MQPTVTRDRAAALAVSPESAPSTPRPGATRSAIDWLLAAALAVPLVVYAYLGTFARYIADDYCTASIEQTQGFWAAQPYWYLGFSPRYAFTFFVSLAETAGTGIVPVLPAVALVVGIAVITWTLGQFAHDLPGSSLRSWPARLVLAEALVFVVLATTPDRQQSLYWQTGMLTYFLPLVLAALMLGWLRRGARVGPTRPEVLAGAALIPLVAGGLSETYLAPQVGALGLAVLAAWTPLFLSGRGGREAGWLEQARLPLLVALAGAVLAFLLDAFSPSTAGREAGVAPGLGPAMAGALGETIFVSIQYAARRHLLDLLLLLCLPPLLGVGLGQTAQPASVAQAARRIGVVGACGLVLVYASVLPSYYALGGDPPARALIVPTAVLSGWVLFAGMQLAACLPLTGSAWVRRRWPLALALALGVALVPVIVAAQTLPERATAAADAGRWDSVDQQIRAAAAQGVRNVQVAPQPRFYNEPYVGPDPTDWFNTCVARFYGVSSIRSTGNGG